MLPYITMLIVAIVGAFVNGVTGFFVWGIVGVFGVLTFGIVLNLICWRYLAQRG